MTDDLKERLLELCNGHPNATIPWPHRVIHDALAYITDLEARLAAADKQRRESDEKPTNQRHEINWLRHQQVVLKAALSENLAAEEGAMMILTQTIAERDAAHQALSESQALLAMWPELAAHFAEEIWEPVEHLLVFGDDKANAAAKTGQHEAAERIARGIRALTPADAQAALDARINAAKEEGYLIAMAEAKKLGAYIVAPDHCPAILAKIKETDHE